MVQYTLKRFDNRNADTLMTNLTQMKESEYAHCKVRWVEYHLGCVITHVLYVHFRMGLAKPGLVGIRIRRHQALNRD